jgi:hypothetical protein
MTASAKAVNGLSTGKKPRDDKHRTDFRFRVPARTDRKHSWSQHAKAGTHLYRVLRRWEFLAAQNDGFIYEATGTTAKSAHPYGQKDGAPSNRTAQRIKKFCRKNGIIGEDADGTSNRKYIVRGFLLNDHSDRCHLVDGYHVFTPPDDAPVSRPCRRKSRVMTHPVSRLMSHLVSQQCQRKRLMRRQLKKNPREVVRDLVSVLVWGLVSLSHMSHVNHMSLLNQAVAPQQTLWRWRRRKNQRPQLLPLT